MMSVMRMKPATADYNHLMNKGHIGYAAGEQSVDTKDHADSLPKPRPHLQTIESKDYILHEVTNMNNNKAAVRRRVLNQGEVPDDVPHSQNSVPVPVAWSPGMVVQSNPSLMITPQRPSLSAKGPFLSRKENILEPQSAHKIPQPVAWSPGMKVQPDPNLFITPEKVFNRKIIANVRSYDCQATDSGNRDDRHTTDSGNRDDRQTMDSGNHDGRQTENASRDIQNIPAKAKNLYTVRFDLPSSTSEDESKDMLSETDSPITIRGRDLDVKEFGFGSPDLKSFGLQKTYNPGMYSDDSSLDESILNSLPKTGFDKRNKKQTSSGITKSLSDHSNVQAYVGSDLPDCTPGVTESLSNDAKPSKHIEADQNCTKTGNKDVQLSVSKTWPQRLKPKSGTSVNTRIKVPHDRKKLPVGSRIVARADRPSSHLLSTESPPEGPLVIREMKNHLLSTKYSFPFELAATTEDCEYEHVFARPEFNSTLAMREQLDSLHDQEVDVMKAVQATLARSEVKRSELNEKAAGCTNRVSGQFKNLIDLNTSVESLCDRVVRMRTSKVPKKRRAHTEKKSSESQRAPDMMEFFTSDLLKEYPDVTLPSVTLVTSQLMTSPPEISFDLYRHNRLWQGISDF